jgi:hypothetical protein
MLAKVTELQMALKDAKTAEAKAKEALALVESSAAQTKAKLLVDAAIAAGKVLDTQRASWEALATSDYDNAKVALDGMTGYKSVSSQLNGGGDASDETETLKAEWDKLHKTGKLAAVKEKNPERYEQLRKAKYEGQ